MSKRQIGCGEVTFLRGQQGSIRQTTYLVLTRGFLIDCFKIPFLGEAETVIQFQFGDMRLDISDPI